MVHGKTPILVAGSGRSGTTWLSDELGDWLGTAPVFEPLHRHRVPEVPMWGRNGELAGKYIPTEADDADFKAFFWRLFAGEICNSWTRQDWRHVPHWARDRWLIEPLFYRLAARRTKQKIAAADVSVIKLIKANLMLAWLDRIFDVRIIYVVRHPCRVVGSRLSHRWSSDLDDIIQQPLLMEQLNELQRQAVCDARNPLQRLAILWCVENALPLRQAVQTNWLTLSYEECTNQPSQTFQRIADWADLGRAPNPRSNAVAREKPWHHPLTEHDGLEVLRCCELFGVQLYAQSVYPMVDMSEASVQVG